MDVGKSTKWILLGNLKRYGVSVKTGTEVVSIKNGLVTYTKDGASMEMQFDHVILAAGSRSIQTLSKSVTDLAIPYATVGDCVQPGKLNDAIHGGFLAAMGIS